MAERKTNDHLRLDLVGCVLLRLTNQSQGHVTKNIVKEEACHNVIRVIAPGTFVSRLREGSRKLIFAVWACPQIAVAITEAGQRCLSCALSHAVHVPQHQSRGLHPLEHFHVHNLSYIQIQCAFYSKVPYSEK